MAEEPQIAEDGTILDSLQALKLLRNPVLPLSAGYNLGSRSSEHRQMPSASHELPMQQAHTTVASVVGCHLFA